MGIGSLRSDFVHTADFRITDVFPENIRIQLVCQQSGLSLLSHPACGSPLFRLGGSAFRHTFLYPVLCCQSTMQQ